MFGFVLTVSELFADTFDRLSRERLVYIWRDSRKNYSKRVAQGNVLIASLTVECYHTLLYKSVTVSVFSLSAASSSRFLGRELPSGKIRLRIYSHAQSHDSADDPDCKEPGRLLISIDAFGKLGLTSPEDRLK